MKSEKEIRERLKGVDSELNDFFDNSPLLPDSYRITLLASKEVLEWVLEEAEEENQG